MREMVRKLKIKIKKRCQYKINNYRKQTSSKVILLATGNIGVIVQKNLTFKK